MTRRGGDEERLAPVTPLFGAPATARPASEGRETPRPVASSDDDGWYVPGDGESSGEPGESYPDEAFIASESKNAGRVTFSPAIPDPSADTARRLPTFADFDRPARPESGDARGVLHAAERFVGRRAGRPPGESADEPDGSEAPRRRIENVSTAALARRGLSEREVRSRLMDKGFTAEQVGPEVQRLLRAGYLDDRRLAEEIIRVEAERKGKGRSAIVAELRRRGIEPDDFADAIAELDSDDELERARDLVNRKLSSLRGVDDETAKRRLHGALARRGFGGDVVRTAIAEGMIDRP